MDNIWSNVAGVMIVMLLLAASGCNGWCSWSGPGLKLTVDGKAHYIKTGDR